MPSPPDTSHPPPPARRSLAVSLLLLGAAIVYTFWPFDLIPDLLGPLGFIDDIGVLAGLATTELIRYLRQRSRFRAAQARARAQGDGHGR